MFIGTADGILKALELLSQTHSSVHPICLAVAFWGDGADQLIRTDKRYRVVCNLTAGGTNPGVIRMLWRRPNVELKHLPNLHAKVSLFERGAIVSSANFSKNGLWLEGQCCDGWDEAAYRISSQDAGFEEIAQWFAALFERSVPISEEVLLEAETRWTRRAPLEPVVPSAPALHAVSTNPQASVDLNEDDLFERFIKPRNRFRMAAPWLIQIFSKIESVNKNSCYVPAYVANMIWTQSGKDIATNVPEHRIINRPSVVLDLAIAKSKSHGPRIRALLEAVVRDDITPRSVKHWASECVSSTPNEAFQGML